MFEPKDDWSPCRQTLEVYSGDVKTIMFSPNSKLIASASDDQTAEGVHRSLICSNAGAATSQYGTMNVSVVYKYGFVVLWYAVETPCFGSQSRMEDFARCNPFLKSGKLTTALNRVF